MKDFIRILQNDLQTVEAQLYQWEEKRKIITSALTMAERYINKQNPDKKTKQDN